MKVGDLVRDRHEHFVGIVVSFPEPRRRLHHRALRARPVWEVISEGG